MSEEQIKKDVVDQLYWDSRVDPSSIQVTVSGGRVTLTGKVPTYGARQAAETDCFTVYGVTSVVNELEVQHPEASTRPSDDEIAANIKSLLLWNPDVNAADISVSSVSGLVTLEGTVDAYWKKLRAEQLSSSVAGVVKIVNDLAVVPSEKVTDRVIADSLMPVLDRDSRINADTVSVEVREGVVRLSGTVPGWTAHQAAQEAAQHTPGVVDVQNDLIIA